MLVHIPAVLSASEVARCRAVLERSAWVDGRTTAGAQSALAKNNLQAPEDAPEVMALGDLILAALGANETFVSAALPLRVFPPLFNRYDVGMGFGAHVDNTIRFAKLEGRAPVRYRTDLSATLFLTDPQDYDGGELVIQGAYGEQAVKFAAGDMVVYSASSVHRVAPITRGSRWASFFWAQSMVRDDNQRAILFAMDRAIQRLTGLVDQGDASLVELAGVYHNLLRQWAEV